MLGVLGGTSLFQSRLFSPFERRTIETPHGRVVYHMDSATQQIVYIQRHHADADRNEAYAPPHHINHRANVAALHQLGVRRCVGVCSVGSLNPDLTVGTCVIPDDFSMLPVMATVITFYEDDARGHKVPALDEGLRADLRQALTGVIHPLHMGGTYVQTRGPRFETPAEVRALRIFGDVVGMTAGAEAVCCGELDIRYAQLCMVDNLANGLLGDTQRLSEKAFLAAVQQNLNTVERAIQRVFAFYALAAEDATRS